MLHQGSTWHLAPVSYLGYILNYALPCIWISSSVVCMQVVLVSLSSSMCHPVPLGFSKLLLACTMVPLPPTPFPSAQNMGCSLGLLAVKYVVYSSSATWKLPSFLVFGVLELLQCRACPAAYCLQLSVFCSVEGILAPASWSILPPRQRVSLPRFRSVYSSAVCKMPSYLACLRLTFSGVESALTPCLVCSFSCYRVQVALHPGSLRFDLL